MLKFILNITQWNTRKGLVIKMSEKYIRIWNESGFVSRIALEKLGLSTKRNDPTTIGQFGSGIKFAPIAALRNGWKWFFTGQDSAGSYVMEYAVETEEGVPCIVYNYGDCKKSSSFTLDAGILSWDNDFQIYREAVANAMDEGVNGNAWGVDIVDQDSIKSEPGIFSVYITASPSLMEIHNNFDKYFLTNRISICSSRNTDFYTKIDNSLRLYNHGVLIFTHEDYISMYDYNVDSLRLNEERTLASQWDFEYEMTFAIAGLTDTGVIKSFLLADAEDMLSGTYEFSKMMVTYLTANNVSEKWKSSFFDIYPENSVICDTIGFLQGANTAVKIRGYNPVVINDGNLYALLSNAGIKTYDSVLSDEYKFDIDYEIDSYPNVSKALKVASAFEPGLLEFYESNRIGIFSSEIDNNLGLTINMNKPVSERKILVNLNHVNDTVENIISTIVHEYDHASTGFIDGNNAGREFRDLADKRIGKLMMNNFKESACSVIDDVVVFPLDKLPLLNNNLHWIITKSNIPSKMILSVGSSIMLINDTALFYNAKINGELSGTLYVNGDINCLYIAGLTNVLDIKTLN